MENWKNYFSGKRVTIMGIASEGRGVQDAEFIARFGGKITVTDRRLEGELEESVARLKKIPNINFVLGEHLDKDFIDTDLVVRAATAPLDSPYLKLANEAGVPVHTDESLFFELAPKLITVGVTGTRGKSTTTQLIYEVLRGVYSNTYLAGNLRGLATLPLLDKVNEGDYLVLELDSWKLQGLGEHSWSPHIAVFTTFLNDHMNYYKGDMQRYFDDKANIYRYQNKNDFLIAGKDVAQKITDAKSQMKVVSASDFPGAWKLQILGEHNRLNAALAVSATRILGLSDLDIKKGVEIFSGLPGRLEYLGLVRGVHVYNDNNATTPDATIAALNSIRESYPDAGIIVIGGGADKELDFTEYKKVVAKLAKSLILFKGVASDKIKTDFPIEDVSLTTDVESMKLAVETAFEEAREGDVIVLSPGAASFGVFKNEYDRNDQFVLEINKRK